VDFHTVLAWLDQHGMLAKVGGAAYIEQVARHTALTGYATAHAQIVVDHWERRQMIATFQRLSAELYVDGDEWQARKAEIRGEVGRVTAPASRLVGRPIGAVVEEAREQVRQATSGQIVGVRYPWEGVERLVGILARGQQTVLAGLSEHGKTAAMMQIVCSVASTPTDAQGVGEAVYVMSGEMPGAILLLRTACSFAGIDAMRMLAGHASHDELVAMQREFDALERLPIIIDDKAASAEEVARRVRAHQAAFAAGRARMAPRPGQVAGDLYPKCRLQLAVGDHAQELGRCEEGRDERERIEKCAMGWLEHIAKGCDVATLLLSQLRVPEQKGPPPKFPPWPVVEQLFGAPNALKRSADTVIAVQRPELLMQGSIQAKWIGVLGVCKLKGRFGGEGRRVLLGFDRGVLTAELPAAARVLVDEEDT
jgi:replicative DNA helicase